MTEAPTVRIERQLLGEEVAKRLRELVEHEHLWGKHLAPERELAKLFGVGRGTLRRGIELLERQGVLARRHGKGTLVLTRPTRARRSRAASVVLGSYMSEMAGPFFGDIMAGITLRAAEAGWTFSPCNLAEADRRRTFFAELAAGSIAGVMLLSFTDRPFVEELRRAWNGPIVLVDHCFEDCPVSSVVDDSELGARQAVEHLLGLGHRRIAHLDISMSGGNPARSAGYAGALERAGLGVDPALVVPVVPTFDAGREAAVRLLSGAQPPTAILAFDDLRAWGAWRGAESLGLTVGRDVAIVGYGDTAARLGCTEELTSVRFDARAMGLAAAQVLAGQLGGRPRANQLIKVPTELVIRKSSAEARRGAGPV